MRNDLTLKVASTFILNLWIHSHKVASPNVFIERYDQIKDMITQDPSIMQDLIEDLINLGKIQIVGDEIYYRDRVIN